MSEHVAAEDGQNHDADRPASAEPTFGEAVRTAERLFKDLLRNLDARAKSYREQAGFDFDDAQALIVAKVKERPITAAAAGFGVGLILGLLLSNRSR